MPIVEAFCRKGKISAIGALTVSPVRRRCGLSFQLLPDSKDAHAEETVAFPGRLRRWLQGGTMTILCDQSRIHQRSSVAKTCLARHPEVATEEFLGYAPDATPEEGAWGWTKGHRSPNIAPAGSDEGGLDCTANCRHRAREGTSCRPSYATPRFRCVCRIRFFGDLGTR